MNSMKKNRQYEVLEWASLFLEKHHREKRVAELLLQHHLQVSRSEFFVTMRDSVPEEVIARYEKDIVKHAKQGVPIQHLIGYESFYGRTFHVNQHVLIPRPETEELVQHVIQYTNSKIVDKIPTIVDAGTGSGIIAITLALELKNASIYATDISNKALATARENSQHYHTNIRFYQGDFLIPLIEQHMQVDIIVSNPPYISRDEVSELPDTVKNFDPELALFADENGLAAYKQILSQSKQVLRKNGCIAFEIGHEQGEAVTFLVKKTYPNSDINVLKDINGKDRILFAKL